MNALGRLDRLFGSDPFDFTPAARQLFVESFAACADIHYQGNRFFRGLWDAAGLKPAMIRAEDDLLRAPPIMVNLFKEQELMTGPAEDIVLNLTSSGTSGQKSQIFLNQDSGLVESREETRVADSRVPWHDVGR
ncbi:hypothetical protein EBZ80_21965 [bacterium]|nr:hypothetical protein [bacterium]